MSDLLFTSLLHIQTSTVVTMFLRYLVVCCVDSGEFPSSFSQMLNTTGMLNSSLPVPDPGLWKALTWMWEHWHENKRSYSYLVPNGKSLCEPFEKYFLILQQMPPPEKGITLWYTSPLFAKDLYLLHVNWDQSDVLTGEVSDIHPQLLTKWLSLVHWEQRSNSQWGFLSWWMDQDS